MKKRPRFLWHIALLTVALGVVLLRGPFLSAQPVCTPTRDKAVAKYGAAVFRQAALYAKANHHEKACELLSTLIFLNPRNQKAGMLREKLAREIDGNKNGEEKTLNEKSVEKNDFKIKKTVLKEFPKVVDKAVKQRRFTDAAYWIRFVCSTIDLHSPDESLAGDAQRALKKLRSSAKKLCNAKAYWQVLAVAGKLRAPGEDRDDEIDKLIAEAERATKAERAKRDEEVKAAMTGCVKRKAGKLFYWIALPDGYEPDGKSAPYPVVVSITGAGADYNVEINNWSRRFRKRGFIFAVPVTTSNTGPPVYKKFYPDFSGNPVDFDHAGITKMLKDLENLFAADRERFSGGRRAGSRRESE